MLNPGTRQLRRNAIPSFRPAARSPSHEHAAPPRWILFALLLAAGILNLVDRQIISVLKPVISKDLGWNDNDYGTLAAWFQGSAAVAFLFTGWIVDAPASNGQIRSGCSPGASRRSAMPGQ
jgi:MFS family permease